jgi:hypothetical protein
MKPKQNQRRKARPHLFDELGPISDEAAAVIAQLLSDLYMQFEERFVGQIMRHHHCIRASPTNPNQPWLTGLWDADEPF